ncbi:MAG: electron transfer flavoprotein subunit alpha/FixB family protein [Chitinophagales bacterium]
MAGIWVLAENPDQMKELLSAGRTLADGIGSRLVALILPEATSPTGADEVYVLPALPEGCPYTAWVPIIAENVRVEDPDVILIAGTMRLKEMAARLSARLKTGLCSNCTAIRLNEDKTLEMDRLIYGGAAVQTVICRTRPVIMTIPPRTFEAVEGVSSREVPTKTLSGSASSASRIIERKAKAAEGGKLADARVVVCVGRGVEKEEDLALVYKLAEVLGGEIGCTRPISEEMRWLPEDICIGLSGKQVKPDLYVGIGISGQIQHLTGIRDAKVICAINKDENAPIFASADLGITGDLYQVLPELIKQLEARR